MWPFSSKDRGEKPRASIKFDDIIVYWDSEFCLWEFESGDLSFSMAEKSEFEPTIFECLPKVNEWIKTLDAEIDKVIAKHLDDWCEWDGDKSIVCVDVSWLQEKNQIDISYAGNDNWGDLGINVVIIDGLIDHSYAGD